MIHTYKYALKIYELNFSQVMAMKKGAQPVDSRGKLFCRMNSYTIGTAIWSLPSEVMRKMLNYNQKPNQFLANKSVLILDFIRAIDPSKVFKLEFSEMKKSRNDSQKYQMVIEWWSRHWEWGGNNHFTNLSRSLPALRTYHCPSCGHSEGNIEHGMGWKQLEERRGCKNFLPLNSSFFSLHCLNCFLKSLRRVRKKGEKEVKRFSNFIIYDR